MTKMKGAQILIETLMEQGVDTVFGYPGGRVLQVYEQLYRYNDKINHYLVAHEQGAAHAADGYSRATGKVGVCMTTSGPGATNLVTGIATAYMDSVPMVAITANVSSNLIGADAFQEVDIVGITLPITKHSAMVFDVTKLADTVRLAFRLAKEGRPGPVLIDIPSDVLAAECEYEKKQPLIPLENNLYTNEDIDTAVEIINKAKKPVILVGGGCGNSSCEKEIDELAKKLCCPVVSTLMGLGVYSGDNFLGMAGMHGKKQSNMSLVKSDLIIAVGSRFNDRVASNKNSFGKGKKIIHIDIDKAEINKNLIANHYCVGDAKKVLADILKTVKEKTDNTFLNDMKALMIGKDKILPQQIMETIEELNPDGIMVTDVGQHQMWTAQYFKVKKYRQLLTSGGLGTMGYGLGASIGAKLGTNETVTLITGDGCFGMNCNELNTIARYNVPVIICLMNNGVLGMVRQLQNVYYDKHFSQTDLMSTTDYEHLSKAYGLDYFEVKDKEDFEKAYKQALQSNKATLINCYVDKDLLVAPMVNSATQADKFILE